MFIFIHSCTYTFTIMPSDAPIISCDNIHKTYLIGLEGVPALRGVELDVYDGEFLVVYGSSGGGKTTLLNVLGTIDFQTKGNLYMFGERITDVTPDSDLARMRCDRMGFVFQSFNLLSTMSALENVCLPMLIKSELDSASIKARATKLLEDVKLSHRLDHYISMLSGGEQQRVTIARALANKPDILFLDEPTGDLDWKSTLNVINILLSLNEEQNITMVMITHDVYMKQYAHRVMYMRDGKVHKVEKVPTNVRARAWEKLRNSLDKIDHGENEVETVRVEDRVPEQYDTYSALTPIEIDENSEMAQIINKLFPK